MLRKLRGFLEQILEIIKPQHQGYEQDEEAQQGQVKV
jgi:hypothetical protein